MGYEVQQYEFVRAVQKTMVIRVTHVIRVVEYLG